MTNVNLMHGDCLERMNEIPDGSVDMILADLPYGTTACKWDVVIPFEPLWKHYWRVIKANGAVLLFGSEPFSSHLRMSAIKQFKYDWIWQKSHATGHLLCQRQPMRTYEVISVFFKKQSVYNPQISNKPKENIRPTGRGSNTSCYNSFNVDTPSLLSKDKQFPKNIIKFNIVNGQSKIRKHSTQKPLPLLEYLIRTYTNEGETVLDNVMGSGSTGVACLNTQRKFIGIEKDAAYFEIAKNRIGECLG